MSEAAEGFRRRLAEAHTEAMRVGDSPVRADRLAETIERIRGGLDKETLGEERVARTEGYLDDSLRALRRDDDGRQAANYLQSAMRLFESVTPRKSPFLDDL